MSDKPYDVDEAQRRMVEGMLDLSAAVGPMHDWLAGQRAYFVGQGYNRDEATAMSAAEFVCIFGARIQRDDPVE